MNVIVKRGSLYLPGEIYNRYFANLEGVILQRRGDDLVVLPVQHVPSGGYLLKRRNAAGDRVVTAADFFRSQGIDDDAECCAATRWDSAAAGLCADAVFATPQR